MQNTLFCCAFARFKIQYYSELMCCVVVMFPLFLNRSNLEVLSAIDC